MATEEDEIVEERRVFEDRFLAFARNALAGDEWTIVVAEHDERLVGTIWIRWVARVPRPSDPRPGPLGYVTNVFIEVAERDRGLGSSLLSASLAAGRERDADVMIVWPSER